MRVVPSAQTRFSIANRLSSAAGHLSGAANRLGLVRPNVYEHDLGQWRHFYRNGATRLAGLLCREAAERPVTVMVDDLRNLSIEGRLLPRFPFINDELPAGRNFSFFVPQGATPKQIDPSLLYFMSWLPAVSRDITKPKVTYELLNGTDKSFELQLPEQNACPFVCQADEEGFFPGHETDIALFSFERRQITLEYALLHIPVPLHVKLGGKVIMVGDFVKSSYLDASARGKLAVRTAVHNPWESGLEALDETFFIGDLSTFMSGVLYGDPYSLISVFPTIGE
ncbi:MAG: hypothetical protein WC490_06570 [Candidatus Margulisiibacteriota bacterium]